MSLRFSDAGPAFPDHLVDSLLTGDVVFFCGAGVSAPQLPGFAGLVRSCFDALNIEMDQSEQLSFRAERYEEVLGTLRRRIVDPGALVETVSSLLVKPLSADLSHHRTILRLSRDLSNQPTVITTNFDNLLEHALYDTQSLDQVQLLSFAGQSLPLPGSAEFGGIIHLHGRIADTTIGLTQTPLVLTSADYGDAYMRSAWASRFLFDLVRCKTIVLIGYSAGDAPVRYLLNVLEADRERFPELKHVYAFDSVGSDKTEADARWRALAVTAIPYQVVVDETTGTTSYDALWSDLSILADLIEQPKSTRTLWAAEILARPFSATDEFDRDKISWIFNQRDDLNDVIIDRISDPAWFDFFVDKAIWKADNAAWLIALWIQKDFTSVTRLNAALYWHDKLGSSLRTCLKRLIQLASISSPLWSRAWDIFLKSDLRKNNHDTAWYALKRRLKADTLMYSTLIEAVDTLTPTLILSKRFSFYVSTQPVDNPMRLSDLFWAQMTVPDTHGAGEMLSGLLATERVIDILQIAFGRFEMIIGLSRDAELIDEFHDANDFSVPSIESNRQNDHHDGILFLVRLIAEMISRLATADRVAARNYAIRCRDLAGRVSARLWLHILRLEEVFNADEAFTALMQLPKQDFWASRPELPLVIKDRAASASPLKLNLIENRIIDESTHYFDSYHIDEGQVDWRSHARDSAVWLRLNMLLEAHALSPSGHVELEAIIDRRDDLKRTTEERDFFGTYSSGVRSVQGNATPIVEADKDSRVQVALETMESRDFEIQNGWSAYCRSDIRGARDTLSQAPLNQANARLWRGYISTLSHLLLGDREPYVELARDLFSIISNADDLFISSTIKQLSSLYWNLKDNRTEHIDRLWVRLFALAIDDERNDEFPNDIYSRAINSSAGQLMLTVIEDLDRYRKSGLPLSSEKVSHLVAGAKAQGRGGMYARAILIRDIRFVMSIDEELASAELILYLSIDNNEGDALREILIDSGSLSPATSHRFKDQILRGLKHIKEDAGSMPAVWIVAPPLNVLLGNQTPETWGIVIDDTRRLLREGPPALRRGALQLLNKWLREEAREGAAQGPPRMWLQGVGPLLAKTWPRERQFRDGVCSSLFAAIAVGADNEFPKAFRQLRAYMLPLQGNNSLHFIESSQVVEKWPKETLDLLWQICGPASDRKFSGLSDLLSRITANDASLEKDRRLQWLYHNTQQF